MFGKILDPRTSEIEINRIIRIESQLGSGGSGTVYKAWHKRLRNYVVVKEIKHSVLSDIEARRNEVEALKNVKSTYLPKVLDFLAKGDCSYTVMEYIEGESFDKLIERGQRFTEVQIIKWYAQLASALEAIHRQNICHCDIKPANIMLTPSEDVCLIDFNTALVGVNSTRLASRSPGYASPEQNKYFQQVENTRNHSYRSCQSPIFLSANEIAAYLRARHNLSIAKPHAPYGTEKVPKRFTPSTHSTPTKPHAPYGTEKEREKSAPDIIYSGKEPDPAARWAENCEVRDAEVLTPILNSDNKTELVADPAPLYINWKLSDIYSLGATMYHLLTGKHPHKKTKAAATLIKQCNLGKSIKYIIERSMRQKPTERYTSAKELAEAIRDIQENNIQQKDSYVIKAAITASICSIIMLLNNRIH